jgi:hypothetical protein
MCVVDGIGRKVHYISVNSGSQNSSSYGLQHYYGEVA